MRNVKASAPAFGARSMGAEGLDRVIGIAPSSLLPGESEADYMGVCSAHRCYCQAEGRDRRISDPQRSRLDASLAGPDFAQKWASASSPSSIACRTTAPSAER